MNDPDSLIYYNITLQILKCACMKTNKEEKLEREKYLLPTKPKVQPEFEKSLFSRIQDFFDNETPKTQDQLYPQVKTRSDISSSCQIIRNYILQIDPAFFPRSEVLLSVLFCVIVTIVLLFAFIRFRKRSKYKNDVKSVISESEPAETKTTDIFIDSVASASTSSVLLTEVQLKHSNIPKEERVTGIPLAYQLCVSDRSTIKWDVAKFLNGTIDKMFSKLDRTLITSPSPAPSQAVIATPRLARRSLHRRQRIGSSPSLQLHEGGTESLPATPGADNYNNAQWKVFKQYCSKMAWKEPICPNVNETELSPNNQELLHYFQRVCPLSSDIWNSSTMITNYALLLLESEFKQISNLDSYRFIELLPSGSAKQGTKVGKANQFDVLMVLQPPVLPCEVINTDKQDRIPPGNVLICVKTDSATSPMKQGSIGKLEMLDTTMPYFLSASEFYNTAEQNIYSCLQNLYTRNRAQIDRLPFKISRTASSGLSLTLDTKNIVGLGIPEIKVVFHPVLCLPMEGWFQEIMIYATPPQIDETGENITNQKKSAIPRDYLWNLDFSEMYLSYMESIELKMKHAGVISCHMILLMILKSLFTGCNRNNLLDRGELLTPHISHAISFLLLESSPEQWKYDHLADRFSDIVNFLLDAFRNERLPSFYLNNPHLIKKVPFVGNRQIFKSSRQHNILAAVPNKEKCLEYIEKCLRESGMKSCVKDDYSSDMWEYEFFVY